MPALAQYPNILANGDTPDADLAMANWQHLRTFLNTTKLDAANIQIGGISASNLFAAGVVDLAALADGAATSRKIKPTAGVVADAALNQTISSQTPADLSGVTLSITPAVASKLLVTATFDCSLDDPTHTINQGIDGLLKVDSTVQSDKATMYHNGGVGPSGNIMEASVGDQWVVTLTAAAHTVKLQAALVNASGTESAKVKRASFSYLLVAS